MGDAAEESLSLSKQNSEPAVALSLRQESSSRLLQPRRGVTFTAGAGSDRLPLSVDSQDPDMFRVSCSKRGG